MINSISKQKQLNSTVNIIINSTFNNIIITVTDLAGNTIFWASSGTAGFKGTRKKTPYAAQHITTLLGIKAKDLGITKVYIIIKGRGNTREIAIKTLKDCGLQILSVVDKTAIAFNGCRAPKKRRL